MRRLSREHSRRSLSARPNPTSKHLYFCHYRNGMYMGQVQNFQRHGSGMVLHDNGTTILSSYYQDMLHGDNLVFFANGACMSARYNKDRLEEAFYRGNEEMFFSRYRKGVPDGGAVLINFKQERIDYINYRGGTIAAKSTEDDNVVLNRVFVQKKYSDLIPKEHLVNVELEGVLHDEINVSKRAGKILVGFSKERFLINGLGFVLLQKGSSDSSLTQYEMMERGYYKSSQLSGFGHRNFKNGNFYTGEFKYDQFEGTGVLKNIHKHNWVSGNFEKGTLVELITYGNEGDEKAANKAIEQIHERKTSWVDRDLTVPSQYFFEKEVGIGKRFRNDDVNILMDNKRSEVLRRIQDNFILNGEEEYHVQESDSRRFPVVSEKGTTPMSSEAGRFPEGTSWQSRALDESGSSRRNRIFESNPRLQSSTQRHKTSFRLQVSPVPVQNSKQIESRLVLKQPQLKETRDIGFSFLQKTPPRGSKGVLKSTPTQLKRESKSINKSTSASNVNAIKLIDSMYKKNQKTRLF